MYKRAARAPVSRSFPSRSVDKQRGSPDRGVPPARTSSSRRAVGCPRRGLLLAARRLARPELDRRRRFCHFFCARRRFGKSSKEWVVFPLQFVTRVGKLIRVPEIAPES